MTFNRRLTDKMTAARRSINDEFDVIIIGAGMSGMTAALTLLEKEPSLEFLLIEARNEIGGRTVSPQLKKNAEATTYNDLGSQYVSSRQEDLLKLIRKFDIDLDVVNQVKSKDRLALVEHDGIVTKTAKHSLLELCDKKDTAALTEFFTKIEHLCKQGKIENEIESMKMEEFINKNAHSQTARDLAKFTIYCHCGVEASNISVGFYVFFCTSTHGILQQMAGLGAGFRQYRINNSLLSELCHKIAEKIAEEQNILSLNEEVSQIKSDGHYMTVETRNHSIYQANNIIIAIPPCEVQKIKFHPPLPPEKVNALSKVISGDLGKFVATYPESFWFKKKYSGGVCVVNNHSPKRPLLYCHDEMTHKPVLSGYFMQKDAEKTKEAILNQLSDYFGKEALHPVSVVIEHWTSGSPMSVFGSLQDFLNYRKNNGRIFWAGAETSMEWYGCLGGAVLAGKMAAYDVLYDLRPGVVTSSEMSLTTIDLETARRRHQSFNNYWVLSFKMLFLGLLASFIIFKMWRRGIFSEIQRTMHL